MRILVLLLILIVGCNPAPKDVCDMAVDFTSGSDQIIDFGNVPAIDNMTAYTLMSWINIDSVGENNQGRIYNTWEFAAPATTGFAFGTLNVLRISFQAYWGDNGNDSLGSWATVDNTLTITTWYHVAVTYDGSVFSNDPVFYVNGVAQTLGPDTNPTNGHTYRPGTGDLKIGNRDFVSDSLNQDFDGLIEDARIYNRVLSATEILEIYNSRAIIVNDNGLVFHCPLIGAGGLQSYDGATLGASNLLVDRINGATGAPASNPVGAGSTQLNIAGGLQWEEGRGGG